MTEDILNRLKKHTIKGRKRINGRHRYCTWCDIIDEIERLRAETQQVRLDHITTLAELQEAAAEIEWLKEALTDAQNEARREP